MLSLLILLAIVVAQIGGDYFVKIASTGAGGLFTVTFMIGMLLYGATAIGWYFLMKIHSLAEIGVIYSASTLILLAVLGHIAFNEAIGLRQLLGLSLALVSIVIMKPSG